MTHLGDRTTASFATAAETDADEPPRALGLTIAWSAHEPERVGEVAFFAGARPFYLGRSEKEEPDVVSFVRSRPGSSTVMGPPRGAGISRKQLAIRVRPDALAIENVGRCPLRVNGADADKTLVVPGDTVLLRKQLLLLVVSRAAELPEHKSYPAEVLGAFGAADRLGILGESPAVHRMREDIGFAARALGHVLVRGESGTGKELAARAIHTLSSRKSGPLVARNAATFPSQLIDAELFGNVKNYPQAGIVERKGLFGEADGGTLFLDEIGELPEELQSHLLRVLDQNGEYQRLGESAARRADVRVIGATHRPATSLRHDLLARLKLHVEAPALAARREDIPLLVRHLLRQAQGATGDLLAAFERDETGIARTDAELVEHLLRRDYAGNVRELEALLWRSMQTSTGKRLALTDQVKADEVKADVARAPDQPLAGGMAQLEITERELVAQAMQKANGNQSEAARLLGISRIVLRRRLERYGLGRT